MFYSLKNTSGTVITPIEKPWEYSATKIPDSISTKEEYSRWSANNATEHAFISAAEATMPGLRISASNPVHKLHGFIVDYDAPVTDEMRQMLLTKPACEFKPKFVCATFSGGARLIWTFDKPLLIPSNEAFKRLATYATKQLKLTKWLPGFDSGAFGSAHQHYEIGKRYMVTGLTDLPHSLVSLWLYKACEKLDLSDGDYAIPIAKVAAEVEARWPGVWKGAFEIGARGTRFWDPTAQDESGCVIMEHGVMAFSGEQAFISWRKLLGPAFVEQFEADKMSGVIDNTAYDGRDFWFFDGRRWITHSKEDYTQMLRVQGFEQSRAKQDTASEMDRVQLRVKLERRVERAMPFVYYPMGIIRYDGVPYLNTSSVSLMEAAPPDDRLTEWKCGKDAFPFIYRWWNEMFGRYSVEPVPSQLVYVLGELWYGYTNILTGTPKPRHVQIIMGDPNCGKTIYANKVLGALYGGCVEANDYFVEGSEWTEHIFEKGLLCIDDPTTGSDLKKVARMTSLLKRLPANGMVMYNAKFKKSGQLPYRGGITFTLNMDDNSMALMPDLDSSTKDKFCLFKAMPPKSFTMPKWGEAEALFMKEIPFLLRFIMNWTPPEALFSTDSQRFGIKAFHHPDLLQASLNHGNAGIVLELLIEFARQYKDANPEHKLGYWEGTATVLYEMMAAFGLTTVKQQTVRSFATSLGVLHNRGIKVESLRDSATLQRKWRVDLSLGDLDPRTALSKGVECD